MPFQFTEKHIADYHTLGYTIFQDIIPTSLLTDLRRVADKAREITRKVTGPQAQRLQPIAKYDLDQQPFKDYQLRLIRVRCQDSTTPSIKSSPHITTTPTSTAPASCSNPPNTPGVRTGTATGAITCRKKYLNPNFAKNGNGNHSTSATRTRSIAPYTKTPPPGSCPAATIASAISLAKSLPKTLMTATNSAIRDRHPTNNKSATASTTRATCPALFNCASTRATSPSTAPVPGTLAITCPIANDRHSARDPARLNFCPAHLNIHRNIGNY